jgi:uncharacterized membrane protein
MLEMEAGMKGVGLLVTGLLLFTSCAVFDELLNPSDITGAVNLIKDTLPPSLTITSPSQGQEVGYIYQITGNVSDTGSGVKAVYVKTDNGVYVPASITTGVWAISISNLSMGTHTNYVYAEDNKGNTCDVQTVVIFRTSVPVLNIVFPNSWYKTEKANLTISGTVSIESPYHITNVKVSLNGGGWSNATGTNSWSLGLTLALGTNTIRVLAYADNGKTNLPAVSTVEYKPWTTNKFTASDGAAGDSYGESVAISADGKAFVVGASWVDDNGAESGAVYYYKWNGGGWDENKFIAPDGSALDHFGSSIAISGDGNTIVAGCSQDDDMGTNSGSVYRFYWNGSVWETNKFLAYDGTNGDIFGLTVALSADGKTVFAGAPYDNVFNTDDGSVYRFQLVGTNWITNKFTVPDDTSYNFFGNSLSITPDGNTFIAGADKDYGAAFLFKLEGSTWISNRFSASDGAISDNFGASVAVSSNGNTIIAGAQNDNDKGDYSGSVFYYHWNGLNWDETKILAYDGAGSDFFGNAVAVSADGKMIIVGSPCSMASQGKFYKFYSLGPNFITNKFIAYDAVASNKFGCSLAITPDGNRIISGASGDNENGNSSGSAYLFTW